MPGMAASYGILCLTSVLSPPQGFPEQLHSVSLCVSVTLCLHPYCYGYFYQLSGGYVVFAELSVKALARS